MFERNPGLGQYVSFEAGGIAGLADEGAIVCVLGYFVVGVLYLDSHYVLSFVMRRESDSVITRKSSELSGHPCATPDASEKLSPSLPFTSHAGHTRTSWPPTWCALTSGVDAWSAARCREYSDPIRFRSDICSLPTRSSCPPRQSERRERARCRVVPIRSSGCLQPPPSQQIQKSGSGCTHYSRLPRLPQSIARLQFGATRTESRRWMRSCSRESSSSPNHLCPGCCR